LSAVVIISLGTAYFERYPDSFSVRNSPQVLLGYRIIRVCILEKAISSFSESCKLPLRTMFFSAAGMNPGVELLSVAAGMNELINIYLTLSEKIKEIRSEIDIIPNSMIKERYIGAITNFYNLLYLFKASADQMVNAERQPDQK
jgi:hypothetical protein